MSIERRDPRNSYSPNRVLTTAESFGKVSKDINFPRNLYGKVVLDVGSGGSDTVAELKKRGANALGVDIQYGNIHGLTCHLAQQLVDPMAWVEGRNWPDITKEQAYEMLGVDQPMPPKFAQWMISHLGDPRSRMALTHRHFLNDASAKNSHYIAATAESLPFRDKSVDFYFSIEAITAFMLGTKRVFERVMDEAHRVIRPGGEIQLHPWISPDADYWSEQQVNNGIGYMKKLRAKNIPFEITRRRQWLLLTVHP